MKRSHTTQSPRERQLDHVARDASRAPRTRGSSSLAGGIGSALRLEQQLANALGSRRTARLARHDDLHAAYAQVIAQRGDLRRLTDALAAFDRDELSACMRHQRSVALPEPLQIARFTARVMLRRASPEKRLACRRLARRSRRRKYSPTTPDAPRLRSDSALAARSVSAASLLACRCCTAYRAARSTRRILPSYVSPMP